MADLAMCLVIRLIFVFWDLNFFYYIILTTIWYIASTMLYISSRVMKPSLSTSYKRKAPETIIKNKIKNNFKITVWFCARIRVDDLNLKRDDRNRVRLDDVERTARIKRAAQRFVCTWRYYNNMLLYENNDSNTTRRGRYAACGNNNNYNTRTHALFELKSNNREVLSIREPRVRAIRFVHRVARAHNCCTFKIVLF